VGTNVSVVSSVEAGGMALHGMGGVLVIESGALVVSVLIGGFVVWGCMIWDCGMLLHGEVHSVTSLHGICCSNGMVGIAISLRAGCWRLKSWIIMQMLSFKV